MHLVPKQYAALWMTAWAISFTSAMMINKALDPQLPIALVVWMRCLFGFLFLSLPMWQHRRTSFKTKSSFLQVLRGLLVSGSIVLTYIAYRHLPTHTAATLGTSGPLMTIALSRWLLKEPLSRRQLVLLALGYTGVLLVAQPHRLDINPFVLCSLGANLLLALGIITARVLAMRGEDTLTTLFYGTMIPMLVYTGAALLLWTPMSFSVVVYLALLGGCGAFSQMCLFRALKLAPASFLAPFEYLRLCFLLPLGWFFFQEIPSLPILSGAFLIIMANIILAIYP